MDATETKTETPKKVPKPMSERSAIANMMLAVFVLGMGAGFLIVGVGKEAERYLEDPEAPSGGVYITVGTLVALCGFLVARGVPRGFRATWTSRFAKDKAAVSPIVAVILMVAITVVLAATVFVMVSDIGNHPTDSAPAMTFDADDEQDTVTVVHVQSTTLTWGDLVVTGCRSPNDDEWVDPGDVVTHCSGRVTIEHGPTRSLVYRHDFD